MCFGVRDAIALARKTAATGGNLTVVGDLVHNPTVLGELRKSGVQFAPGGQAPAGQSGPLMITAHGTSKRAHQELLKTGAPVIDATCPLVKLAHRNLEDLVRMGCHPVIVGIRSHVEVLGMTGDLEEFSVLLSPDQVENLPLKAKYGIVAQTTQPLERVIEIREAIQRRFPGSEVLFRDTICQPTKLRQQAVRDLAAECDFVVVVGGRHSNNTRELSAACRAMGTESVQIEKAVELRSEWFDGREVVGLTAGTSTPESDITEVEAWLRAEAARRAERQETATCAESVENWNPRSQSRSDPRLSLSVEL